MPTDSHEFKFGMQVWPPAFGLREAGGNSGSTVGTELLPRVWGTDSHKEWSNEAGLLEQELDQAYFKC